MRQWLRAVVMVSLLAGLATPARANLINGGFENAPPLIGWTPGGSTAIDATLPHSGSQDAAFAPFVGSLVQPVSTIAAKPYRVSFWLESDPAAGLGDFYFLNAFFGSNPFPTISGTTGFGYAFFTADFVGTGGVMPLTFVSVRTVGAFHLDDVSVELIPEPTTLGLLGAGLLGVAGVLRRRTHV